MNYNADLEQGRPYKNETEFLADMQKHGPMIRMVKPNNLFLPTYVGVKDKIEIYMYMMKNPFSFEQLYNDGYKWQDNHRCGISKIDF